MEIIYKLEYFVGLLTYSHLNSFQHIFIGNETLLCYNDFKIRVEVMNKVINYGLFLIFLSFIFVINVNAECSYQERKELLNEAKNVEAYGLNPTNDKPLMIAPIACSLTPK